MELKFTVEGLRLADFPGLVHEVCFNHDIKGVVRELRRGWLRSTYGVRISGPENKVARAQRDILNSIKEYNSR